MTDQQPEAPAVPGITRWRPRKPVVIDAIEWTGSSENEEAVRTFGFRRGGKIPLGSYLVRGITGHFFIVDAERFATTYEPAPEPLTATQLDHLRQMAGEDAITTAGRAAAIVEALEAPPAVAEDIRIQLDVMGALLAALCDPGRFTDRAPHEPMSWWQRRAVIEHAAPYIAAAERERVCKIADDVGARYLDGGDWSASARLSDLIRRLADG